MTRYMLCTMCCTYLYTNDTCMAQSGCDIMHTVDLGVWVHLITAIAVKLQADPNQHKMRKGWTVMRLVLLHVTPDK